MTTTIQTQSEPIIELRNYMGTDDDLLRAMLVSTGKDDLVTHMTDDAKQGRLNFLMKNRHGTPFEHASMTFYAEAPLAVFYEWHRHRIGVSYNEESGRYRQLRAQFYAPTANRPMVQSGKPGEYKMDPIGYAEYMEGMEILLEGYQIAYEKYEKLIDLGWAKEIARMVLPVGIIKAQYVTFNPRSLMAFLSLRTDEPESMFPSKPMYEIDQVARKMEKVFSQLFPITYYCFNQNGRVAP